ncbi:hypothetical protein AAG906_027977 [Vitis piasezkii]
MNFMSYEHLVEECPTIPAVREMFGDCNTYNSNWRDHPNFSWKPQPPQYKQHVQATQQASNLEQAMVNLSKVMGDFVGAQKSINAHLSQRIDSVESSLNKRMDEVQNDLSQKIDNLQDSISRFANLNIVQEKGNFPSQPYQNSKGIHEMEAQKEKLQWRKCKMMKEKEEKREFWPLVLLPLQGIFGALPRVHFIHTIYRLNFGSQESNAQTVSKSELKQKVMVIARKLHRAEGNFAHLNPRCENFRTVKPLLAHECHFAHPSQFSHRANSLNISFAHHYSRCENFRTVRNTSWHTSAISHTSSHFSHRAKQGAKISHTTIQGAKFSPTCEFECENFTTVGHIFEVLPEAQIMHVISRFKAWEVRNPSLQTVSDLDLKRRSYGRLKTTVQS